MNTVLTVLTFISKIVSVIDSGMEVRKVYLDKDRTRSDVVNACANGAFAVLQISDICVRYTPLSEKVPSLLQKGTASMTAGLDGVRFVTKKVAKFNKEKWTWVEVALTSLEGLSLCTSRLGDLANVYQIDSSCPRFNGTCQKVEKLAFIVGTLANLGTSSIRLYYNTDALNFTVKKIYNRFFSNQSFKQNNSPNSPPPSQVIEQNRQDSPSSVQEDEQEDPFLEQREQEQKDKDIKKFLFEYEISLLNNDQKGFFSKLKEVPYFIDVERWRWYCSISKKPIRFLVIPNIPREKSTPEISRIYYERETLKDWIQNNPKKKPPNWPNDYWPLSTPIFIHDDNIQETIDLKIFDYIEFAQEIYSTRLKNMPKEELGISIEEKIDKKGF